MAGEFDTTTIIAAVSRIWGFDSLRPLQHEAIEAGLTARDSLVVLPTGGGKSLCYQVPPIVADRMDVVVSPLISLMKDQVDGLRANGYRAAAIHSGLEEHEKREIAAQIGRRDLNLLFVAPERLANMRFLDFLGEAGVSSFAIDEAHCISHWGHDFRPEYRRLLELREAFPDASFHAFTATATERVRADIIEQLNLRDPTVLVGNFDRPNLVYRMVPRVDVREQVIDACQRHADEAVIVYCISRKETETIAGVLQAAGIHAEAYHAGLESSERRRIQDAFAAEQLDVVVATVAFGMGIDRSNVRCVIHAAMPKSIEHYQQETGRAGRDGLEAECVLFYSLADVIRWERLIAQSAEGAVDPEAVMDAAKSLLREMQLLASGTICRHRRLVEYFGQSYPHDKCDACDVCLHELDVVQDSLTVAQKIISCVARIKQRFGVKHIVDVLTGGNTDLVRRCQHDQLSVFGLLDDVPKKEVQNLTHQLIDQGFLTRAEGDRPIVTLNERSGELLRGEIDVQLVKPPVSTKRTRFDTESWEGVDHGLFELLRDVRRELAKARGVPAFVIMNDATVRDLARRRPSTIEAMRQVYGIGEAKLKDIGPAVFEALDAYCTDHSLDRDAGGRASASATVRAARSAPGEIPQWKRGVFDLFRDRGSIESVMEITTRARRTVVKYLCEFIEHEQPESVDAWVDDETYRRVADAAGQFGLNHLRPVHDELGGHVEYDTIRIVITHLHAQSTTDSESPPSPMTARE